MRRDDDEPPELPADALLALKQGRKIDAIKALREATGCGLKEAKEQVERYAESDPVIRHELQQRMAETRRTLIRWVIVADVIIVALVLWYFFGRA